MTRRYSGVAIALHWLLAIAILAMIPLGGTMHDMPDGAEKFALYQLHKSIGITILLLTLVRLGWRLTHKPPPLPLAMPAWQRVAARASHVAFYVLMLGIPLAGWAIVSASPWNIPTLLYGAVPWPHLPMLADLAPHAKKAAENLAKAVHETGVLLLLILLAVHVLAALKHRLLDKDGVLERMLPW